MVDGVKYFRIGWQVNIEKVDHWICGLVVQVLYSTIHGVNQYPADQY